MVHLPPGCNFTVQPQENPHPALRDVTDLNSVLEKDEAAHCYREHFIGMVIKC